MGTYKVLRKDNDIRYKVSIVVPCYKVERFLPRCLDSLVFQTLPDIEVICINDGSPDKCLDILIHYQEQYSDKIVVIDKVNEGVWKGRRDAIAEARGEYIGFVDSDDFVEPDFCERLYTSCKDNSADISVCGFNRLDVESEAVLSTELAEGRPSFSAKEHPEYLLQLNGAPWNKLFKASLLKNMYDFATPPKIFDDMMMHLLVYPGVDKVSFVSKPLVNYIIREGSIMTTIDESKVGLTYSCMLEVKRHYEDVGASRNLMSFLDAAAFLHLGVSLVYRISTDRTADLSKMIKDNRAYLNTYFSGWSSNAVISLSNAVTKKGVFLKVYFARLIYKMHLMAPAMAAYRAMISGGRDIKW